MAEKVGFEPTEGTSLIRLAGELLKPLGHFSIKSTHFASVAGCTTLQAMRPSPVHSPKTDRVILFFSEHLRLLWEVK